MDESIMDNLKTIIIKYRQPITFAFVGVINTGVDFLVFTVVLLAGTAGVIAAQAMGYIAGLTCSFFLNKYITFKNNTKSLRQGILFLMVNGVTMLISMIVIYFFHSIVGVQEHIAKLFFVTPITMVVNYLGYKYVVFVNHRG